MSPSTNVSWTPGEPVWLESPNYVARSLRPEDVTDRIISWFSDAEVMRHVHTPAGEGRERITRYFGRFNNETEFMLGVFVKRTGQPIGFRQVIYDPSDGEALLTLVIGEKDFQSKGINREMQPTFYEFLFVTLKARKMIAEIFGENVRSHRLALAAGYKLEKVLHQHYLAPDGTRRDVSIYGMGEAEWRAKRKFVFLPVWRAGLSGRSGG